MLAHYPCFARRVKRYSEKEQGLFGEFLLCMGLFFDFCFGAVGCGADRIGARSL